MHGAVPDVSSDLAPPAAPTPLELDPRTSPEPAEPTLKKRKIPSLAAPSDSRGAVGSGSPSVDAVGNRAWQPSSGELSWPLTYSGAFAVLQQDYLVPSHGYDTLCQHHG